MVSTTWAFQIAILVAVIGGVVFLVGFSTTQWFGYDYYISMGLWRYCVGYYGCQTLDPVHGNWFNAVQAMECLGLVLWFISTVLMLVVLCQSSQQHRKPIKVTSIIGMGMSGICIIIGVIIFGAEMKKNLGYSFWLCTISGVVALVTTMFLLVDICMKQPETATRQPTAGTQVVQYPVMFSPTDDQRFQYPAGYHPGVVLTSQFPGGYPQTLVPMGLNQVAVPTAPPSKQSANSLDSEPPPYSSLFVENYSTEKDASMKQVT